MVIEYWNIRKSYSDTVHGVIHNVHPTFECCDLKQRQIGDRNIIKRDPEDNNQLISSNQQNHLDITGLPRIDPNPTLNIQTDWLVGNNFMVKSVSLRVYTLLELAHVEVDTNDGEDQPEDDTHCHHVEDTRQGSNQSRNHNLDGLK